MAHEDTLQSGFEALSPAPSACESPATIPSPSAATGDAHASSQVEPHTPPPRRATGFALMDADRRKAIASQGGKAAHARGTAHRFDSSSASAAGRRAHERGTAHVWTPEAAREAGRKGGRAPRKPRISATQATRAAQSTPSMPPSSNVATG